MSGGFNKDGMSDWTTRAAEEIVGSWEQFDTEALDGGNTVESVASIIDEHFERSIAGAVPVDVGNLLDQAQDEIRQLRAAVADKDAELKARREILDALSDAAGNGDCWLNALDWRQRLRDFAEDSEQHQLSRGAWKSNRKAFPGLILYAAGGFYTGYYDDAAELWGQAADELPMFHVMVKSDPPHRTAIHPLHLNAWMEHLADICLPVTVIGLDDPE